VLHNISVVTSFHPQIEKRHNQSPTGIDFFFDIAPLSQTFDKKKKLTIIAKVSDDFL
jgi:hypothetical protein